MKFMKYDALDTTVGTYGHHKVPKWSLNHSQLSDYIGHQDSIYEDHTREEINLEWSVEPA